MSKIILELKNLLDKHPRATNSYKRNLLKEYLQFFVLDYIYSSDKYNELIFYGGSALAQCYALPRLSEDLDFVDIRKTIDLDELSNDLGVYFKKELGLIANKKIQKFRIYLKFPILRELGISDASQSNFLNLKVEIFKGFDFCDNFKTELKPTFRHNQSVLIKTFDLPTLMATKIRAVLYRKWEKINKSGETIISVKGRDYFDLMWYLQKGITPNFDCLEDVDGPKDLKIKLLKIIEKIDSKSIILDLENFVNDVHFVKNLGKNIKEILKNEILK